MEPKEFLSKISFISEIPGILVWSMLDHTRWVALMIQLEQQQHGEFVVVVGGVGWLTPTTYIQLAGAGSTVFG